MINYKKIVKLKDDKYAKIDKKLYTTDTIFLDIKYKIFYEDKSILEFVIDNDLILTLKIYTSLGTKTSKFWIESLTDLLKVYSIVINGNKYSFRFDAENFFTKYNYDVRCNYLYDIYKCKKSIYDFLWFSDFNDELQLAETIFLYLINCHTITYENKSFMINKMLYFGYNEENIEDIYIDFDTECNPDKYLKLLISDCLEELYYGVFSKKEEPMENHKYLMVLFNGYYKNKYYKRPLT